jgi:hypothetical protein
MRFIIGGLLGTALTMALFRSGHPALAGSYITLWVLDWGGRLVRAAS